MTLTTHHLEFTVTALTPLELDDQAGASIRGAVVGGLWERFCANKAADLCRLPAHPGLPGGRADRAHAGCGRDRRRAAAAALCTAPPRRSRAPLRSRRSAVFRPGAD